MSKSCKLKNGKTPKSCMKYDVSCKDECNSLDSCIAYSTRALYDIFQAKDKIRCSLIIERPVRYIKNPCPLGWHFDDLMKFYADTVDDLVTGSGGSNCMIQGNS